MLEEYELEEGATQDLTRIIQDAERCRNTVKELLEFARQTRQAIGRRLDWAALWIDHGLHVTNVDGFDVIHGTHPAPSLDKD